MKRYFNEDLSWNSCYKVGTRLAPTHSMCNNSGDPAGGWAHVWQSDPLTTPAHQTKPTSRGNFRHSQTGTVPTATQGCLSETRWEIDARLKAVLWIRIQFETDPDPRIQIRFFWQKINVLPT